MQFLKNIPLKISREEVLRLLKHKKDTTAFDKKVSDLIDKLIEEGKKLTEPKAVYSDHIIKKIEENSVLLDGIAFAILGKSAAHRLWGAAKVTFFAVTIGENLEKRIHEYTREGILSSAAILDAVGSVAVESVVDYVNVTTNNRALDDGFKTVQRFSPGYGDWDLKEQRGLLGHLNAAQIGIALTSGNLMQPEKSVSGVIGWIK